MQKLEGNLKVNRYFGLFVLFVISQVLVINISGYALTITKTIRVEAGQTYDGGGQTIYAQGMGDGSQDEDQDPIFRLAVGATLRNVRIGAPGCDGVHCYGNNLVENVVWEDVGEDALTVKGDKNVNEGTVTVRGCSASHASDKVFQINAPCTFRLENVTCDDFGKVIRQNGGTTFQVIIYIDDCTFTKGSECIARTDSSSTQLYYSNMTVSNVPTLWMFPSESQIHGDGSATPGPTATPTPDPTATPTPTPVPTPETTPGPTSAPGNGDGLLGEYYSDTSLSNLVYTTVDPVIDINWGGGSPNTAVPQDQFSAQWTGNIEATMTETYTIYTLSDDGMRVWIDNQLVIDDWNDHAATEEYEQSGTINMQMGTQYDIRIEYYENGGDAAVHLSWETMFLPKEIIPQRQLYSGGAPTPTPSPTPTATSIPEDTPESGNIGDANGDGNINIVDALLVAQYYVGLDPSPFNPDAADTNCDGSINIVDSLLIAQYYVGLINTFC